VARNARKTKEESYADFADPIDAAAPAGRARLALATATDVLIVVDVCWSTNSRASIAAIQLSILICSRFDSVSSCPTAANRNATVSRSPVNLAIREAESAAQTLRLRLTIMRASNAGEMEQVFAMIAEQRIGAVLVNSDRLFVVCAVERLFACPTVCNGAH
jgi:hypothetical protein